MKRVDSLAAATKWTFNPESGAKVLLGQRDCRYPFEAEATLYLFIVWIFWPTNKRRLRNAARLIGGALTFARIGSGGNFRKSRLRLPDRISARLTEDWYNEIDDALIQPLGGLPRLLGTTSLAFLTKERNEQLQKLRMSLDLVDFTVRMASYEPALATRRTAINAIVCDFYKVNDHYGVRQGEKRQKKQQQADAIPGAPPKVVGRGTAEKSWDDAPETIVLIYAFREMLHEALTLDFKSVGLLCALQALVADRERLTSAFAFYEAAMGALEALPERPGAIQRWRVLSLFNLSVASRPTSFTDEQVARFTAICRPGVSA